MRILVPDATVQLALTHVGTMLEPPASIPRNELVPASSCHGQLMVLMREDQRPDRQQWRPKDSSSSFFKGVSPCVAFGPDFHNLRAATCDWA